MPEQPQPPQFKVESKEKPSDGPKPAERKTKKPAAPKPPRMGIESKEKPRA